jgi:ABC-type Fe3+/spermidine/putrescine transport system ATPase subunit
MTALLQAQNLGKSFRDHAVFRSVSFELHTGQHLALLGPSGCGKSSLLRLLAGLDAPTEGQLSLDGRLVSDPGRTLVPPHERKLAMVFQDLALWPTLNALDNVLLGMARVPLSKTERRTQALEALRLCNIETLAHRKPAALSIGQQQRVALARAVAIRPKLLLLDEPFSSLDLPLKQELMTELRQVAEQFGVTLLLVTHDPSEARGLCSHALVLEEGGICERGTWIELMASPVSKTLQAFARATNNSV